jgi:PBSX family phage terminase large subunit
MAGIKVIKRAPKERDMAEAARPYQPRGNCRELFARRDSEVLLSGGAGTGKSCAALNKIFGVCEKYPGIRVLICRKTRESLTESILVTWEEKVVPVGHPCLEGPERNSRKEYVFPEATVINDGKTYSGQSRVIIAGLRQSGRDNTQKVMSTDYDLVYVPEAIELTIEEWEKLLTRLRNHKLPYQQLIADTNPSSPNHWLKKRCEPKDGKPPRCLFLDTTHQDNPLLWDADKKEWTKEGADYIHNKLDVLTGVRRDRFRDGKWVQAEGVIYENWQARPPHLVAPFPLSKFWRRFRVIDFGFTNAFVCQWYAIDDDGRLILYREYVKTKMLVEDHAEEIKKLSEGDPPVECNVCDHDAEDRATLEKHLGEGTISAKKEVSVGIQQLESRLKIQEDGKPRFIVFDTALANRDKNMEDEKKPIGFVEEVDSYVWDTGRPDKAPKEEPLGVNDHSCFPAGTEISVFGGVKPIENIAVGDLVLTTKGYRQVAACGQTAVAANFIALSTSNGKQLLGTSNHPVFIENRGWTRLDAVSYADKVIECHAQDQSANSSYLTESSSGDILIQNDFQTEHIFGHTYTIGRPASNRCIKRFGKLHTARFLKAVTSTTKTETRSITISTILNALLKKSITRNIHSILKGFKRCFRISKLFARSQSNGMAAKPDCSGTANTERKYLEIDQKLQLNVLNAKVSSLSETRTCLERNSVRINAEQPPGENLALTTKSVHAKDAARYSESINTGKQNFVRTDVVTIVDFVLDKPIPVFNLTVEDCHEYFANSILVHNCDCARYACMYMQEDVWVAPVDLNEKPNLQSATRDEAADAINWRNEFDRLGKEIDWRNGNPNWRGLNDDLMNDL